MPVQLLQMDPTSPFVRGMQAGTEQGATMANVFTQAQLAALNKARAQQEFQHSAIMNQISEAMSALPSQTNPQGGPLYQQEMTKGQMMQAALQEAKLDLQPIGLDAHTMAQALPLVQQAKLAQIQQTLASAQRDTAMAGQYKAMTDYTSGAKTTLANATSDLKEASAKFQQQNGVYKDAQGRFLDAKTNIAVPAKAQEDLEQGEADFIKAQQQRATAPEKAMTPGQMAVRAAGGENVGPEYAGRP